jgi:hypothetical protein
MPVVASSTGSPSAKSSAATPKMLPMSRPPEAMQTGLDAWLDHDTTERPHPGDRNQGRRRIETVMSFVSQDG